MSLDESQAAEAARQAARNQRMKDLFSGDTGKLVLRDIFEQSGMHFAPPRDASHSELAFEAGQRSIVLWILTCMDEGSQGVMDRFALYSEIQSGGVNQEVQQ